MMTYELNEKNELNVCTNKNYTLEISIIKTITKYSMHYRHKH